MGPVFTCPKAVVGALAAKVSAEEAFIVIRRGVPLTRLFSVWKRVAQKVALPRIKVNFIGEVGIDDGAIGLEFFEETIAAMRRTIFSGGTPVHSTSHVSSGFFQFCGQLVAVSLSQGGPPPCFLEECSYKAMLEPTDLSSVTMADLTEKELQTINTIASDVNANFDLISDHGYTGVINPENKEDITKALQVSYVMNRQAYMKEFSKGMEESGLLDIIRMSPGACKPLFVPNLLTGLHPDAMFISSLLQPEYSNANSSRKTLEELIIDNFQNMMFRMEDGEVASIPVPDNWMVDDEERANDGVKTVPHQEGNTFDIPALLGWLTGTRHVPLLDRDLTIKVKFKHGCPVEGHICYPSVSACTRELTLPVNHMKSPDSFTEVFREGYYGGRDFGMH